jgi:ADP-heptose:LPS heptosyltransferase
VVVWGPGEEELARSVIAISEGGAILAPATSLRLLAAMLRRASLFVGADTGPMHLAWAVGCPVVALFGPTDPRLNAPLGNGHRVLRASSGRMEDLDHRDVLEGVLQALVERRTPSAGPPAGPVVIGGRSRGQG